MAQQHARMLKNQAQVQVMARSYHHQKDNLIWGAIAAASLVYLFSFFFSFSFTGGRAPAGY